MKNNRAKVDIRRALNEDLRSMLSVEQHAFPKHRWASFETLQNRLELFPFGNFVAVFNHEIIGFCNGFPIGDLTTQQQLDPGDRELFSKDGRNWLLRNVAVSPEFQGQGIGSELVASQLDTARQNNSNYLRFTATPNLDSFYSRLGFKKIREPEDFHGLPQALWEMKLSEQ